MNITQAEIALPCEVLKPTLDVFVGLGFRIDTIYPAEEPTVASLSGHGLRLRLAPGEGAAGTIRLLCDDPGPLETRVIVAPNGTRIERVARVAPVRMPPLAEAFGLIRAADGPAPGEGRAGMIYRDLIPDRLGGRFIASHIVIPEGGPVADWVHYHRIRFQMIFCRRGWARLVYEDQGEPFIMAAGDLVLQPPRIRHRVLESSPGLEVVEIGCPALHETLADHDMPLPNGPLAPGRDFDGQRFLHHVAADTPWADPDAYGVVRRETGLLVATAGVADAAIIRLEGADAAWTGVHHGELMFGFVLDGQARLACEGDHDLGLADAFVIPSATPWRVDHASGNFNLLTVSVPALDGG